MKKFFFRNIFLVCLIPISAFASNEWFMVNSPVANFTQEDTTIFKHAVNQALDQNADGKKLSWKNIKSKAHGYVVPSDTMYVKGVRCRELKIYNEAETVTDESTFQFCLIKNMWTVIK